MRLSYARKEGGQALGYKLERKLVVGKGQQKWNGGDVGMRGADKSEGNANVLFVATGFSSWMPMASLMWAQPLATSWSGICQTIWLELVACMFGQCSIMRPQSTAVSFL